MTTNTPLIELTAWMRGRLAERVARLIDAGHDPHTGPDLIITPLGTTGEPGTRADRSCDRCGRFVSQGCILYMITVQAAPRVLCVGGLCGACRRLEDGWQA
ncbi:hypothetical protein ACO0LV_01845 [Pseudactinotalea sp. Z1739]|uniref:hypothetical protein n=1 Tax=Pseudactinotalea sp. Z1739 TaxID=3413028 RepID=UPI003C7E1A2F